MNYSCKIKVKQVQMNTKQDQSVRRVRTDHLEVGKKMIKQPLGENKKIINNSQQLQSNSQNSKPVKKIMAIKSVIHKNCTGYSRLTTQPSERVRHLGHQRIATAGDRVGLGQPSKKLINIDLNCTNVGGFHRNQSRQRQNSGKPTESLKNIQTQYENKELKGQNRYQIQKKIGSGTFGTVHRARDKKTLEIVAIKKVFQDRNYKNRQLDILRILNHPNVLSMKDSFFTYENQKQFLNVVMDYYQCNLYQAIQKQSKKTQMSRIKFKVYAYQLFRSLLYLREMGIAHRDIKPQNILVNQNSYKLVMCDFGSAKQLKVGQPNIAYICSRCYRAPELIFGNTQYTTQIDMWSTGCVLAEMVILQPLFQGESNIDQLVEIIKALGCPSSKQIIEMNPNYEIDKFQLPKIKSMSWKKIFPNAEYLGEEFIDLMKNVLCYSPSRRFTPFQALGHPFFNELREQKIYRQLEEKVGFEPLFNFTVMKQGKDLELMQLIPKWY